MACLTSSTANIDVIDSEKEENYEWTRGQRNCAKHPANLKTNIWFKSPRITEILQSRIWLNRRNMSTVGRGKTYVIVILMWRLWKLFKEDVKDNAVIEVQDKSVIGQAVGNAVPLCQWNYCCDPCKSKLQSSNDLKTHLRTVHQSKY